MGRILKDQMEATGRVYGYGQDEWEYKHIIYQYWDTSTAPYSTIIVVEGCLKYIGEEEEYHGFLPEGAGMTIGINTDQYSGGSYATTEPFPNNQWKVAATVEIRIEPNSSLENMAINSRFTNSFWINTSVTTNMAYIPPSTSGGEFTDEDKIALENNTAAISCKLVVKAKDELPEIILTENNSVKNWEYDDERLVPKKGFVGQFVGRTLNGDFQNISDDFDITNREIELWLGVVHLGSRHEFLTDEDDDNLLTENYERISTADNQSDTTNWYDFGSFIVLEPEDDNVSDNTKFETMDYAKLFNKSFDGNYTDDEFTTSYNDLMGVGLSDEEKETFVVTPVTLGWVAKYTCNQVSVELGNNTFYNNDFEVDINPFQAGETCRDVMKAIGQLAFSWVRIGWDNKCYIDFVRKDISSVDQYNVLDKNQYFSLDTVEMTKPINAVAFGMSGIDGETAIYQQSGTDGSNCLYLYDNPFLYTFSLRDKAARTGDIIFGLSYSQLSTETVGHPWLIGNELIDVKNMENASNYTYPFNTKIKYNGHIRSEISSVDETEVEKTLGYTSSTVKIARLASIEVNKQEGTIKQLAGAVDKITDDMGNYYTKGEVNELVDDKFGLTNKYVTSGGANQFRNTGLWYKEDSGNGYEYWSGSVIVADDNNSASGTVMMLQNTTLSQTLSGIPNGKYTISFKHERLNPTATLQVLINSTDYSDRLSTSGSFEQTIDVTTNSIEFSLVCNTNNGWKLWELMGNHGEAALVWMQHADEVRTDTVNISKGITITSTTTDAVFKANADGIRIENRAKNTTTNFLEDGLETENATIKKQAKISGALHTIVGRQTWISGIL